jgi:hypothetical protein
MHVIHVVCLVSTARSGFYSTGKRFARGLSAWAFSRGMFQGVLKVFVSPVVMKWPHRCLTAFVVNEE